MDALTFGTPILVRHFTMSEARKMPIQQFCLPEVLKQLELTKEQFMDLCILLGCDYTSTIKGVGPVKAMELMKKYGSLEKILANIHSVKNAVVPDDFKPEVAKEEFLNPEVTPAGEIELKWGECNAEELLEFMVTEKQFNEGRIKNAITKLQKMKKSSTQVRMDSFFKPVQTSGPSAAQKRKALEQKKG